MTLQQLPLLGYEAWIMRKKTISFNSLKLVGFVVPST
jgi:hypothetical protein